MQEESQAVVPPGSGGEWGVVGGGAVGIQFCHPISSPCDNFPFSSHAGTILPTLPAPQALHYGSDLRALHWGVELSAGSQGEFPCTEGCWLSAGSQDEFPWLLLIVKAMGLKSCSSFHLILATDTVFPLQM